MEIKILNVHTIHQSYAEQESCDLELPIYCVENFTVASFPLSRKLCRIKMTTPAVNGLNGNSHYTEINHHYAEECSQDDIGSFLFTSESVGEGHPGKERNIAIVY